MPAKIRSKTLGPWAQGVNNRADDTQLVSKDGAFLRSATNVDVSDKGRVKRRAGSARKTIATNAHSLWSDGRSDEAFFVDAGSLYRVVPSGTTLTSTLLRAGLAADAPLSYARVGDSVVYSNGAVIGRIDAGGDHPHGVPKINPEPTVATLGVGTLAAGKYIVCAVAVNADGEESGSTTPVQVDVPEGGTITLSDFPAATVRVYMSEVNGQVLYSTGAAQAVVLGGSIAIAAMPTLGGRCQTLLLAPMPAGAIVRWLNGRLLVAAGPVLYYSEPYAPALTNPAKNYFVFPSDITLLEPMEAGLFIGADKTYWLPDPIEASVLNTAAPHTALARSGARSPDQMSVFWMSPNGLVVGKPDGSVAFVQEDAVAVPEASAGASLYREIDGIKQMVSVLFGLSARSAAAPADSWTSAETVRKATTL